MSAAHDADGGGARGADSERDGVGWEGGAGPRGIGDRQPGVRGVDSRRDDADRKDDGAQGKPIRQGGPARQERTARRGEGGRKRKGGGAGRRGGAGKPAAGKPHPPRPTVAERFDAVDRLLDGSVTDADGLWSRATVWILRLALEQSVDELWSTVAPELARCPMRAQLLALRVFAGDDTAAQVATVWAALSRAAHHHDYELAPSVTELRRWREQTAAIATALATAATR